VTPLRLDDIDREIHATERYLDSLKDVRAVLASREISQMAAQNALDMPVAATVAIPVTTMNGNGHPQSEPDPDYPEPDPEPDTPAAEAAEVPPAEPETGPVNPDAFTEHDELAAQVLAFLKSAGAPVSGKEIAYHLDAEEADALQLLESMKSDGLVKRGRGGGTAGVWRLPESKASAGGERAPKLSGDDLKVYELIRDGEANSADAIAEVLDIKTREVAAICTCLLADRRIRIEDGIYHAI